MPSTSERHASGDALLQLPYFPLNNFDGINSVVSVLDPGFEEPRLYLHPPVAIFSLGNDGYGRTGYFDEDRLPSISAHWMLPFMRRAKGPSLSIRWLDSMEADPSEPGDIVSSMRPEIRGPLPLQNASPPLLYL